MGTRPVITALLTGLVLASSACGSTSVGGSSPSSTPGSTGSGPTSAAPRITLALSGATAHRYTACGSDKPFLTTSGTPPLAASGTLSPVPSSSARVKLKVKQCIAGTWQTVVETHVAFDATGHYRTPVPLPGPGAFTVRAYYYAGQAPYRSAKGYVKVV
ncbi:MAG TPA: hypothetical protein VFJ24_10330 [Gaiellales bacterium]|nr:hypothetical protein [Gaiellales bacterium]